MAFDITKFSSHLKSTGVMQTNRYEVQFTSPAVLRNSGLSLQELLQYRAEDVRLPGITLDNETVHRYGVGPLQRFASGVNFTDTGITFLEADANLLWKYYNSWMNAIIDFNGPRGGSEPSYAIEYKAYYVTDIKINVYNIDNKLSMTVVLRDAFPISLGDVNMAWGDNNQLFRLNVGFAFRDWFIENSTYQAFQSGVDASPSLSTNMPQVTSFANGGAGSVIANTIPSFSNAQGRENTTRRNTNPGRIIAGNN